jgi:8-oxo-dGTP pyrophosphatase MutT (NUDIX family)
VGAVRHAFAERLRGWPQVFRVDSSSVRLAEDLDAPHTPAAQRSAALAQVCAELHRDGTIAGWRDELYPVTARWSSPPLLLLERAAVPLFGVTAYGVHMNGIVRDDDGRCRMWIARRSMSKPTGPGKLDQLVAGGQPHGIGLRENMIKECAEEAGIPRRLARRVRPAGAVRYVFETPSGLRPDVIFSFDLELPPDFQPVNRDGEVEAFYLWPLDRVLATVRDTDAFKFNCSLVIIDFLVRHGIVDADDPDYEALTTELVAPPLMLDGGAG